MRSGHILPQVVVFPLALLLVASGQTKAYGQTSAPLSHESAESHLSRGYEALKQDRYEVAVTEFRAALELDPKLVLRARFPLAVALFEMHQADQARREFQMVRQEVGDHPNLLYYLGRLDLEEQNFSAAAENLRQAARQPPFPDTDYYLGFAYFKAGDLAAAAKWLEQAAHLTPSDSRVFYQLGFVYRKLGREEEAKKEFALSERLRGSAENDSRLKQECAQELNAGSEDKAQAVCEQLYDPSSAEKLTALGTIYAQHGKLEPALRCFRRAATLAPHSPQMQYNLALAYYQLNQFEAARQPLAGAVERWPDLFELNALYGAVLVKLSDDVPAYRVLTRAHALQPQDTATEQLLFSTSFRLAEKTKNAGQYSASLSYLEQAAALRPQDPEPHRRMAEIYTLTERSAQANAERQEAERLAQSLAN